MDKLEWREEALTDSQLCFLLSGLHQKRLLKYVNFCRNKLESIPDLTQYEGVEELILSQNNIVSVETGKLPRNVKKLDLCDNQVSELVNFTGCDKLEYLWLRNNRIQSFNPANLPENLQVLNIENNQLTHMPNVSRCHKLVGLYLSSNQITNIDLNELPLNIETLDMSGNKVTEVQNFADKRKLQTFDLRGNHIARIYCINRDISSWRIDTFNERFFENEHGYKKLIECHFYTDHLIRPPVEVFKRGIKSVKIYFKDLTLSKRVKHSKKRLVLLGPAEAGKTSMVESLIAGEAVLVQIKDRTEVVNLKEWNISEDDILHIYDHGGHFIYAITTPLFISKNSLLFLVHDVTKLQLEDTNKTIAILRQALHQYPDNKMYIIFTHTDMIDSGQVAENSDSLMHTLKQFLDGEISNLNRLLNKKNPDIVNKTTKLLKCFKDKRSNLAAYCVSSKNYSGMEKVKECLVDVAKEKRTDVPDSWLTFYRKIVKTKKICLTLNEIAQLFPCGTTRSGSDYIVPLQYFADSNLCLHYEKNPFLKDYVFPDIDLLVNLFKSLFHENLVNKFHFDNDEKLQANFLRGEFGLAVQQYEQQGLLHSKLLSYWWEKYGLSHHDKDVLIHLMQSFNLCYSISKDENEKVHFFPWFVESHQAPEHIDRDHLKKFDKDHSIVQLQCEFFNQIPLNVFEQISVCLQRKATKESHDVGDRHAWHDGLEVSFGSVQCVLSRCKHNSTIDVCLCGEVDDMPQVWMDIESLYQDLDSILEPLYGVIRSIHFVCRHCVISHISEPHLWLPDLVFPKKGAKLSKLVKCPKDKSRDLPTALVIHVFKDMNTESHLTAIKKLSDYLQNNCKSVEGTDTLMNTLKLCDDCHLKVAKRTFGRQDVLLKLHDVGRDFCFCLSDNIIDPPMREKICKAVTSLEALGHIRNALDASLVPNKVTQVLQVLRLDAVGKGMHADRIEQAYLEELERHKLCEECNPDERDLPSDPTQLEVSDNQSVRSDSDTLEEAKAQLQRLHEHKQTNETGNNEISPQENAGTNRPWFYRLLSCNTLTLPL